MGVPIAIKDIYAVDNMPTTNGSLYDASEITGPEGRYVTALKQSGCIILKTKTVEYAPEPQALMKLEEHPESWDLSTSHSRWIF